MPSSVSTNGWNQFQLTSKSGYDTKGSENTEKTINGQNYFINAVVNM